MMCRLSLFALAFAFLPMAHARERWALRTGDTALTVATEGGALVMTLLSSTEGAPEWTGQFAPILLPDHVFVSNAIRSVQWKFSGSAARPARGETTLRFSSDSPKLELLSIWQAQPGPGPVEHHFEIVNRSGQVIEVPLLPSLALTLTAHPQHSLENWWVEKGASHPAEVGTHHDSISYGYRFNGRSTPYSDALEIIPWVSIQDAIARAGVYFGIEFSGRVGIEVDAASEPLTIVAGLDPSERDFRSRLADGERFVTPTAFVGCYRGDVDDGANRLHRFVAKHLRPAVSDARYPLVVNNSWGSGMVVDEALARHMIDESAALGVEMFHIDAGWFRTVGDWHPDSKKFPNGLAPASDYAHSKGMLFGLWVGWTQGGTESRDMETLAVTNPKQRDWFTRDYTKSWKPLDFTGATVCLADKPARAWCLKELRRIVTSYKLDLLEHDQIMIVDDCDRTDHGHTASPADIAYHAARGYYAVYDQLRKEHPKLLFEDCVNGGHIVDFGIVRRTHYISITDVYDPLSNRRAFYDSSYPLPPSMCECYIENRPGPTLATFKTMLRSGMMGWCTLMCDTGAWTVEQHNAARRQIEIYKKWIRPLINNGDLFHISTRPDDARWDGMQYFDSKTGKGIVFAFRGAKSGETSQAFKLKGLDRAAAYEVWSEDGALPRRQTTGSKLMEEGLDIELGEAGASELIYLQLH
jgi:Melibiase/Glycosyl hydrolase family 36 C-terminal domain